MQLSTSKIFGIPGVALFDKTSAPCFKRTVFFKPVSFICSAIFKIYGEERLVTSEIFSHLNPLSHKYSCIGLGEPPLLIVTKSPSIPSTQDSGLVPFQGR